MLLVNFQVLVELSATLIKTDIGPRGSSESLLPTNRHKSSPWALGQVFTWGGRFLANLALTEPALPWGRVTLPQMHLKEGCQDQDVRNTIIRMTIVRMSGRRSSGWRENDRQDVGKTIVGIAGGQESGCRENDRRDVSKTIIVMRA